MRSTGYLLAVLAVAVAQGCMLVEPDTAKRSPLMAAKPSTDTVSLEIFFAQVPEDDAAASSELWQQIDEQPLSPELRKRLAQNGIRAGLVGAPPPAEISKLLKLSEERKAKTDDGNNPCLDKDAAVTLRVLQARSGHRGEIIASKTYAQLPLLMCEDGQVTGRPYDKAEGRFAVTAWPQTSGRVALELVPELHYGEQHLRRVVGEGSVRLEPGRDRRVFKELALKLDVAPGQMLVMSSLPERRGSLGHYLFTDADAAATPRRLLIIRLAHAADDPLFSPDAGRARPVDADVEVLESEKRQ